MLPLRGAWRTQSLPKCQKEVTVGHAPLSKKSDSLVLFMTLRTPCSGAPLDLCKDLKPNQSRHQAEGGSKYSQRKDMDSDNCLTFGLNLILPEACSLGVVCPWAKSPGRIVTSIAHSALHITHSASNECTWHTPPAPVQTIIYSRFFRGIFFCVPFVLPGIHKE